MKIKYEFATESIEIEVEDSWADVMLELDRQEYNANHRETRRHCSLDALNLDDSFLPSDTDAEADFLRKADSDELRSAIKELTPGQQRLVEQVYFLGKSCADIAREEGVSKVAIFNRLQKIHAQLKKYLSYGG